MDNVDKTNLENQRGFAMDNKVDEDFIRQLGKSLLETYGKDKTVQLIKELERLVRIQASYEKAVEQNGEALRRLED